MSLDPRLHGYQRRAVSHLHNTGERGAGLFLDMGLGKTATVLQALTPDHLPALVLAPPRVAQEVWHHEAALWRPDLTVARAVGTPNHRLEERGRRADITVMTRDTVGDLGSRKHPYKTVVLDELSGYKTKSTNRWKATRRVLQDSVEHVFGLTGTPAPNGYHDLWAQIYLLDKGKRLGPTLGGFRDRYFTVTRRMPVTNIPTEWTPKPGAMDKINALLDDLCLSMTAEEYLDLPDLVFNVVEIAIPRSVRLVYKQFEDTLVADLSLLGGGTVSTANAATLSSRLRQITAGFLYDDHDTTRWTPLHDERTKAVREIVDGTGSPVLVFYAFNAEKDALRKALPEARTIDSPNVISDWNAGKVPVLLAHPASIGHGLNLQSGGHTIVWSSLTWALEEWQQANKRLHRQGQRNNVIVHVLIAPGTVDRTVYKALQNKTSVQDALLDYLGENERLLR